MLMLLAIVSRRLQLHLHRRIHHNGIRHEHLCWQWRGSFQLSIHAILVDFSAAMAPFAFELTGPEVWPQGWGQFFLVRIQAIVTSPLERFIY